jgi:hypothetical protein
MSESPDTPTRPRSAVRCETLEHPATDCGFQLTFAPLHQPAPQLGLVKILTRAEAEQLVEDLMLLLLQGEDDGA